MGVAGCPLPRLERWASHLAHSRMVQRRMTAVSWQPGHARFHDASAVVTELGWSIASLWLLRRRGTRDQRELALKIARAASGSQLCALPDRGGGAEGRG
jgi:hypothetical protein